MDLALYPLVPVFTEYDMSMGYEIQVRHAEGVLEIASSPNPRTWLILAEDDILFSHCMLGFFFYFLSTQMNLPYTFARPQIRTYISTYTYVLAILCKNKSSAIAPLEKGIKLIVVK
jgi:hypothetical protein